MTKRGLVGLLFLGTLISGGLALLHTGAYGLTIFISLPILLGGLASWVFRPTSGGRAARLGAMTVLVALCSLLAIGLEGLICIAMAMPLALPLGALGSWLVYRAEPSGLDMRGGVAMLLLLPGSVTWDAVATPPVFVVHTAIVIAAA